MSEDTEIRFHEIQHVSATPVMLIPLGLVVYTGLGLFGGAGDVSPMVMGFGFTFSVFMLWMYLKFALRVTVDSERLMVEYLPTSKRPVSLADIRTVKRVDYDPVKNFGWGRKGDAWTVSGRQAVEVTLRSGGRIVIGTRRADDLVAALNQPRMTP